ncbi:hypothetical protein VUJ46_16370 [Chryseobacterium sp. MYb264]|uniref:hypothetical protein n=1 Tax=Chryseobacterium sp. MYb264 TaxID=2745153 RepID=UPI002E12016E|nr:hypothetical protein VUJ46_16370 [Chryseobacterium sp. MYb264]
MNSTPPYAEQRKLCSDFTKNHQIANRETEDHSPHIIFDEGLYTIEWSDIENAEIDYENYLSDIENFFREDFEKDIIEE